MRLLRCSACFSKRIAQQVWEYNWKSQTFSALRAKGTLISEPRFSTPCEMRFFPREKGKTAFFEGFSLKRPFSLSRVGKIASRRGVENRGSLISVPSALREGCENGVFGKRCFCPLPKTGGFDEKWRKWRFTFYPQKQGVALLRARKPTKMTKMAGVPQAKPGFAKNRVFATLTFFCQTSTTSLHKLPSESYVLRPGRVKYVLT